MAILKKRSDTSKGIVCSNFLIRKGHHAPKCNGMKHHLTMLYDKFRKGIYNSQKAKEWLLKREIDLQKVPVGYNSGTFHKGKDEAELSELEQLGLIHSPDSIGRYKVFAKEQIMFPIRNRHDAIVNYMAYDPEGTALQILNDEDGYYPTYPKAGTKQLFLCFDLLETAKMCSTPLAEDVAVTHLSDGEIKDHHFHLLDQLPYLQEVVIPGFLQREQITKLQDTILEKRPDVTLLYSGDTEEMIEGGIMPLEQINETLFHAENEQFSCDIVGTFHPDREVTLKLSKQGESRHFRDTLLLYNNSQRQYFIEECCRYLLIDETGLLERFLDDLTESLEQFSKNEGKSTLRANNIQIADHDRQKGLEYLTKEKIPEILMDELLDQVGIVGEKENRMIVWLVMLSRKLQNPLHLINYGSTGTGKSMLLEAVSRCFYDDTYIELTSSSAKAFYHFSEGLSNKVILIQDLFDLTDEVLYQIRELQSKKKLTRIVTQKDRDKGFETEVKTIYGNVSIVASTTDDTVYPDNANRSIEIRMDESDKQDARILRRQQMMSARTVEYEQERNTKQLLKVLDQLILPYEVINPYALELNIPKSVFTKRRTMGMYLGLIEAVCLLNQYNRKRVEKNSQEFLMVDLKDIEFANHLMTAILMQKSDSLNQGQRQFFEGVKEYVMSSKQSHFTQKMLVQNLRLHPSRVKRYIKQLTSYGYISITGGDRYKKGYTYSLSETNDYEKLKKEIETTLNQNLDRAKRVRIN